MKLECDDVDTEHILLGIIAEGENVAVEILSKLGVDRDQVRSIVLQNFPPVEVARRKLIKAMKAASSAHDASVKAQDDVEKAFASYLAALAL